jgi:leader peptidase (prepilin peptidase) / N-methyltransferase
MTAAYVTLIGLLGAAVGSFLNVLIHRLPRGESIVSPRSRCPSCEKPISAWQNVPIVSWLLLRGRCRHCGQRISSRYPLVELLTVVVFVAVALVRGVDFDLVQQLPFAALLVAVAAIDLEHRVVPNRLVVPAAVYGVIAGAAFLTDDLPELLVAGAGAFLAMLAIALAHPRGMGMGDVKLAGVIGLYLGVAVIPALLVGFLAGTAVGLAIMARQGVAARKQAVPFGPFLALGAIVGLLAGPELVDLYSSHFLSS